jgi:predicted flap endonuclease-1-like 5' DNA nuclease
MIPVIILILLMLAAFAIGWLISRLFSKGNTTDNSHLSIQIAEREAELEACRKNNASLAAAKLAAPAVVAAEAAPIVNTLIETPKVDDLKIVEGIGPKIEELLNKAGITTFAQLAETPVSRLKEILDAAGPSYQMHDPSTWPQQTALARDGKWTELKILQDELNGGKSEIESESAPAAIVPERFDDLKIVEGIGPKIEELLNNAGIKTFAQLADTSVARLNEILEAAGPRYQMHDPGTWPQQTALARDGKWTELKTLQDELNKGKVE